MRALVIVHIDSISSLRWQYGDAVADKLLDRLYKMLDQDSKFDEVVVVSQGWGSHDHNDARDIRLIKYSAGKVIKFDENTQEWRPFIDRLAAYLTKKNVRQVVVAGIWLDPRNRHGCVNTTAKGLAKKGFDVVVDESACGVDDA